MYAQHSYRPSGSRRVSLVAALAVNGAILVGMATFVPKILTKERPPTVVQTIPLPQDPPIERPKKIEKTAPNPTPFAPKPFVDAPLAPTPRIDPTPLFPDPPTGVPFGGPPTGPIVVDPPQPPPLIFHPAETDPRYAGAFQPEYPSSEIRLNREGHVTVRVLIGSDGRVRAVEQVSATSAAFFEATKRQALGHWRFRPATRGTTPEESWKTMNVSFVLNGGD